MDTVDKPQCSAGETANEKTSTVPCYSPRVEELSTELIGFIADKWTMLVLEELAEMDVMRFNELRKAVPGISQKMLTQTLRQMERIGLVTRTIHPVIPPKVEYQRTAIGRSLGPAICQIWNWVEANASEMEEDRQRFDGQKPSAH